jgi:hypothetical protein
MKGEKKMEKFTERGTGQDILALAEPPGYLTAQGGRNVRSEEEKKYVESCLKLLDRAAKRHPGFNVKMQIRGGVPTFHYSKRSYSEQIFIRNIDRTLAKAQKVLAKKR